MDEPTSPASPGDESYNIKSRAVVAYKSPISIKVDKGKTYYWCVCGWSKNQPFCDGSHLEANDMTGSEWQPIPWTAEVDGEEMWFCRCKQTKTPPFCDGTHTMLLTAKDIAEKKAQNRKDQWEQEGNAGEPPEVIAARKFLEAKQSNAQRIDGLVQGSWNSVLRRFSIQELGKMLYQELFAIAPELRSTLFEKVDMKKQSERIIEMWGTSVKLLKHEAGQEVLLSLGERHLPYGVSYEHFPTVGEALMALLAKCALDWDEEKKAAWEYVFREVRKPMILGLHKAGSHVPQEVIDDLLKAPPLETKAGDDGAVGNESSYDIKSRAKVAAPEPISIKVKKGKTYYWCVCGHSKNQPFCDGNHVAVNGEQGTTWEPMRWTAEKDEEKWFCQCKQTKTAPFCDGSHQDCNFVEEKKEKPKTAGGDTDSYDIKTRAKVAEPFPIAVTVEKGKAYYWCTCGHSKNQPFCDGSHVAVNGEQGTTWEPMRWTAESDGEKYFCQCKQTHAPPFCDGTHTSLDKE